MRPRLNRWPNRWLVANLMLLGAVACKPGDAGSGDGGSAPSSTGPGSDSAGSTSSPSGPDSSSGGTSSATVGSTGAPTTGGVTDAATGTSSAGAGSTTGAPIECMDVPVTPGGPLACDGEELALDDACDQLAGYEVCPNDAIHRHTVVACNEPRVYPPCTQPDNDAGCAADSECDEYPIGSCSQYQGNFCFCRYTCQVDDDCGPGNACICDTRWAEGHRNEGSPLGAVDRCVPAQCRSDADCSNARCGVSIGGCYQAEGLYCHTPEDLCEGHWDCLALGLGNRCAYSLAEERWVCDEFFSCE